MGNEQLELIADEIIDKNDSKKKTFFKKFQLWNWIFQKVLTLNSIQFIKNSKWYFKFMVDYYQKIKLQYL